MEKYIKREIIPFNDFWINCECTILHSLMVTLGKQYIELAYINNYIYECVPFRTPSRKWGWEVRVKPQIDYLWERILQNRLEIKWDNYQYVIEDIIKYLLLGKIVMVGVDLYYWIPHNMCYKKHHVEHYAIINGFDSTKNIFYVMDTDNVKYREFELNMENVVTAMKKCELPYDAIIYDLCDDLDINTLFGGKEELIFRAKKICKSINSIYRKNFWIMNAEDYSSGFNRDMCVMYILQINCRMKANRRLFEYLVEHHNMLFLDEIKDRSLELEKKWCEIKNKVSKLYFDDSCVDRMKNMAEEMKMQKKKEKTMWKEFISKIKKIKM